MFPNLKRFVSESDFLAALNFCMSFPYEKVEVSLVLLEGDNRVLRHYDSLARADRAIATLGDRVIDAVLCVSSLSLEYELECEGIPEGNDRDLVWDAAQDRDNPDKAEAAAYAMAERLGYTKDFIVMAHLISNVPHVEH